MRSRRAASVVLASIVLLGTAGCTFFAPQTTLKPYDPSDGIGAQVGSILVRNALLLSKDGKTGSLLVNLINDGNSGINVKFQYDATVDGTAAKVNTDVFVDPGAVTSFGGNGDKKFILDGIATKPGQLFPIFVQYGQQTGKEMLIPVLDGTLPQYSNLLPTATPSPTASATPSAPAATPTPTPTPSN
ncbi:MAG: hypothetical protein JWO01_849 [Microbacteriaceae bacterium]|nr:hypothetical protein [Microbacteriaceae bacterium]